MIMKDPLTKPRLRLEFLDGIRGWAALMVLFGHLILCTFKPTLPQLINPLTSFISDSKLAVYVFFVLSGFVLSIRFIQERPRPSLPAAILARYVRLAIPVLASCSIAYLLLSTGLMWNHQAVPITHSDNWLGVFYNFSPRLLTLFDFSLRGVFFHYYEPIYNAPLWTMQWEFKGSIIIYMLGAIYGWKRSLAYAGGIFILIAAFVDAHTKIGFLQNHLEGCVQYGTFIAGSALALAYVRIPKRIQNDRRLQNAATALMLLPVAISAFAKPANDPLMSAYFNSLIAVPVVAAVTFSPWLKQLFTAPISRFLGRISFPFYLLHLLVICSFSSYLIVTLHAHGWNMMHIAEAVIPSTFAVSLIAATLFYPCERFSIRASHHVAKWVQQRYQDCFCR